MHPPMESPPPTAEIMDLIWVSTATAETLLALMWEAIRVSRMEKMLWSAW